MAKVRAPLLRPNLEECPVPDNSQRHVSRGESAGCRHAGGKTRSFFYLCPASAAKQNAHGKGSGGWGHSPYSFGLRGAYKSVTGGGAYRCRHAHSVEANDEGPVVDAVDDGCAGSVGIINRPLEDPLGPNESMD